MGDLGNGLEIGDVISRVADALDIDGLGLVVDGGGEVLGLIADDKLGLDAQTGEEDLKLVVGAAVQVGCGDDVVARVGKGGDGHELGCLPRSGGDSSDASF